MANLVARHQLLTCDVHPPTEPEVLYVKKTENLVPFVQDNWRAICTERAKTSTWWATLGSCLYTNKDLFQAIDEGSRSAASAYIINGSVWDLKPGFVTVYFMW